MSDKICDNTQFVKCIEQFPCIYNYNDADYLKRDISDKAWQEVANEMQLPVPECKEKWKNLRYGLIRSLRLNADGTPKRRYYLHDDMEFILPYLNSKQYEMTYLDVETDEDRNDQENEALELSEPVTKKSKKSDLETSNESPDDSRRMFILGLMPEINSLTNFQMRIFRRKVLALLDEIADDQSESGAWSRESIEQTQESIQNFGIKTEPS